MTYMNERPRSTLTGPNGLSLPKVEWLIVLASGFTYPEPNSSKLPVLANLSLAQCRAIPQ